MKTTDIGTEETLIKELTPEVEADVQSLLRDMKEVAVVKRN